MSTGDAQNCFMWIHAYEHLSVCAYVCIYSPPTHLQKSLHSLVCFLSTCACGWLKKRKEKKKRTSICKPPFRKILKPIYEIPPGIYIVLCKDEGASGSCCSHFFPYVQQMPFYWTRKQRLLPLGIAVTL